MALNSTAFFNETEVNEILALLYSYDTVALRVTTWFLYVMVILTGFVGNLATLLSVMLNRSMRMATHVFICSLTLADLVVLMIYVPTELLRLELKMKWTLGGFACSATQGLTSLFVVGSIYSIVAITWDRYRAILYPLTWRGDSLLVKSRALIVVWGFAFVVSVPLAYYSGLIMIKPGMNFCVEIWRSTEAQVTYWSIMLLIQFIIPFTFILYWYWRITNLIKIKSMETPMMLDSKQVTNMVIILCVIFFVCNAPQHVYFFIAHSSKSLTMTFTHHVVTRFCNFLLILQCSVNPYVYSFIKKDFNLAIKKLLRRVVFCVKDKHLSNNATTVSVVGRSPYSNSESTCMSEHRPRVPNHRAAPELGQACRLTTNAGDERAETQPLGVTPPSLPSKSEMDQLMEESPESRV